MPPSLAASNSSCVTKPFLSPSSAANVSARVPHGAPAQNDQVVGGTLTISVVELKLVVIIVVVVGMVLVDILELVVVNKSELVVLVGITPTVVSVMVVVTVVVCVRESGSTGDIPCFGTAVPAGVDVASGDAANNVNVVAGGDTANNVDVVVDAVTLASAESECSIADAFASGAACARSETSTARARVG